MTSTNGEMSARLRSVTDQLRDLERDGTVKRKVYHQLPAKVEYTLSTHGRTLRPVLHELCKWGLKHRAKAGWNV